MGPMIQMISKTVINGPTKDRITRSFVFWGKLSKWLVGGLLLLFIGVFCAIFFVGLNDTVANSDVAIILGSRVEPSGRPSARLASRLDRAAELYKMGTTKYLLVSGGTGVEGFSEAVVMRNYLVAKGVPLPDIILDEHGSNTYLTAKNCAILMRSHHFKTAIIVTQYFHVLRTRLAFSRQGIAVVGSVYARYFELRDIFSTIREVIALPVYWLDRR